MQKQGVTLDCTTAPELGGIVSDEDKLHDLEPTGLCVHLNLPACPTEK
ncbi:MAG TPA: hypothetical protein VFZ44_03025 [Pyrinomonadaceae bacterium]